MPIKGKRVVLSERGEGISLMISEKEAPFPFIKGRERERQTHHSVSINEKTNTLSDRGGGAVLSHSIGEEKEKDIDFPRVRETPNLS